MGWLLHTWIRLRPYLLCAIHGATVENTLVTNILTSIVGNVSHLEASHGGLQYRWAVQAGWDMVRIIDNIFRFVQAGSIAVSRPLKYGP